MTRPRVPAPRPQAGAGRVTAPLFDNRRQARKARLLLVALIVSGVAALGWGWQLSRTYGIAPGDGGVLRPLPERLAVGSAVALLGAALIVGLVLFAHRYVLRIERDGDRLALWTLTASALGRRRIDVAPGAILGVTYHHGHFHARLTVDAPWLALRIAGHALPFIVDLQAETIDHRALARLEGAGRMHR
ncbi:MAG: hypothetical protein AB7G13_14550 [Lautropia sp.]